jgi:hypothetical protein
MRLQAGGRHMMVTPPTHIRIHSTSSPKRSSLLTSYGIRLPPVMAAQELNQASMKGMPLCRWMASPPMSGDTRKCARCTRK